LLLFTPSFDGSTHTLAMKIPSTTVEAPVLGRVVLMHVREAVSEVDSHQPLYMFRVMLLMTSQAIFKSFQSEPLSHMRAA